MANDMNTTMREKVMLELTIVSRNNDGFNKDGKDKVNMVIDDDEKKGIGDFKRI